MEIPGYQSKEMKNKISGLIDRFKLNLPVELPPSYYWVGLMGPLFLGVSVGMQWMLTAQLFLGPKKVTPPANLTYRGKMLYLPERDLLLYAGGCLLTLILIHALSQLWKRRLEARAAFEKTRYALYSGILQLLLGLGGMGLYLLLLLSFRSLILNLSGTPGKLGMALVLVLPGLMIFILSAFDLKWGGASFSQYFFKPLENFLQGGVFRGSKELTPSSRTLGDKVLDFILPVFICALVYIPDWNQVTRTMVLEGELHHWNYFAMGPALGFSHGKALGTEVFSQYGLAWPMIFSALSSWVPLSYAHMIHLAVLYGCLYFVGIYLLLRLLLKSAAWAATGVFLAMFWQLFGGNYVGQNIWQYPSSTILRSPVDVWFFIALLLHLRSRRSLWIFIAGGVVGLAGLFAIDTGLYLAVTFAFYGSIFAAGLSADGSGGRSKSILPTLAASWVIAGAVWLAGLGLASRGTFWRRDFWVGWLEGVGWYSAGFGMLPMGIVADTGTLIRFAVTAGLYLFFLGYLLMRFRHQEVRPLEVLGGCGGLYGLGVLVLFVGRSHPYNLFHASLPFSLLLVSALALLHHYAAGWLEQAEFTQKKPSWGKLANRLPPWGALVMILAVLAFNQDFRRYPNFLKILTSGDSSSPSYNIRNPRNLRELFPDKPGSLQDFLVTIESMEFLLASGQKIAILDHQDTVYYSELGVASWNRYSPLFSALVTQEQIEKVKKQLLIYNPDYIFLQKYHKLYDDVRVDFRNSIMKNYRLVGYVGLFEIWHRSEP